MSEHYFRVDHIGVEHTIEPCYPVPSGCLQLVSRFMGVSISSYHHDIGDAREQVGRNSCFLAPAMAVVDKLDDEV